MTCMGNMWFGHIVRQSDLNLLLLADCRSSVLVLVSLKQSQVQQAETEMAPQSGIPIWIARRFALKFSGPVVRFVVSIACWILMRGNAGLISGQTNTPAIRRDLWVHKMVDHEMDAMTPSAPLRSRNKVRQRPTPLSRPSGFGNGDKPTKWC